jgi:hypothetical protein
LTIESIFKEIEEDKDLGKAESADNSATGGDLPFLPSSYF